MNTKNFVNFHILISHSPSCLNRDDMNMQKTAVFGGKSRVRISSQSLKRALRFSDYYKACFGDCSVRTRDLGRLKTRMAELLAGRFDAELVGKALELLAGKEGIAEGAEADAVAPWSVDEIAHVCTLLQAGEADEKKLRKEIEKGGQAFREAMGKALDIALSGRMATSGLLSSLPVDGAMSIAHAITTHTVEPQDVDWFTAVDDLTQDAGETGAGHLNTQQFSAGVFYRYASLNLKQLQVNLGLIADIGAAETTESRAHALGIARHVLHLLATVVPSAKQQSFAAHNLCDLALVSFSDLPVSLANAFEAPVTAKSAGFLVPSIAALADYWAGMHTFHSLDEQAAVAATKDFECPAGLARKPSLAELERWVEQGGNE